MLFHPDQHLYRTPIDDAFTYENIYFHSDDGTRLHGWWVKPRGASKGVMVVVHGNAQNLTAHYRGWIWVLDAGYELFIFDYRGYGESEGEPGLVGAIEDTDAALKYVNDRHIGPLYVCGQSLGGVLLSNALATDTYADYRLAIIDSSYSELQEMGRTVLTRSYLTWPFQWVSYLVLRDDHDPLDDVAQIHVPLLFIAGSDDGIIPPNNSWQLFDAASRPREMWLVQGAGHIQALDRPDIQKELLRRMQEGLKKSPYSVMRIYETSDRP